MNLVRKFLISKKSHSIVNLVAVVSVIAIAVPTAAMIIVLSLHNGLTSLVEGVYGKFDSELRVTPRVGQLFEVDSLQLAQIREFAEVAEVLECNAILQWEGRSTVATLKGVDSSFKAVSVLPYTIERGVWQTGDVEMPRLVMGAGVSYNLALSLGMDRKVDVYALLPNSPVFRAMGVPSIASRRVGASGVFTAEATIDSKYVFTDLQFVRSLMSQSDKISALEIQPLVPTKEASERISKILGEKDIVIKTQKEQRQSIYSTIESEKVILYFTLLLIALIAAMTLAGCSLMMTTEKAEAARVLRSLGMSEKAVRNIFLKLSMLVICYGAAIGTLLGVGIVLIQQYFEPLKMAGYQMLVESYPVELHLTDLILTLVSIITIGYLIIQLTIGRLRFKTHN